MLLSRDYHPVLFYGIGLAIFSIIGSFAINSLQIDYHTWSGFFAHVINGLLMSYALWYIIGLVSKDMKSANLSFLIHAFISVLIWFYFKESTTAHGQKAHFQLSFVTTFINAIPYVAFAWFSNKSIKAIVAVLIFYMLICQNHGHWWFYRVIEPFLRMVNLDELLEYKVPTDNPNSYRVINFVQMLVMGLDQLVKVILFIIVYEGYKKGQRIKEMLFEIVLINKPSTLIFSIVFFISNLFLPSCAFGIKYSLGMIYENHDVTTFLVALF